MVRHENYDGTVLKSAIAEGGFRMLLNAIACRMMEDIH